MLSRIRFAIALAVVLSLIFIVPAFAGGWAVITVDELPSNVIAGKPVTIGFTVLQHGRTPMSDLHPTVTARLDMADQVDVIAKAKGKPGHYTAELTFPKAGQWDWSIQAFTMDQPMPVLTVVPSSTPQPPAFSFEPLWLASGAALIAAMIGALIAFRRRTRQAMVWTVGCLLLGLILSIAAAGGASKAEAQSKSSTSQVEWGRQLFLAKGCITCHVNNKAAQSQDYLTIQMGAPDLSSFSASPEVLRLRLHDPSSVKSDTKMPRLTLSDEEIEALIAFINSK